MTLTYDTFTDLDSDQPDRVPRYGQRVLSAGDVIAQMTVNPEAESNVAPESGSLVLFGIGAALIGIVRCRFV
jgi:hypothetical protein